MSSTKVVPPIAAIRADEPEAQSADLAAANIQALKALFPDAMNEGGVDFDTLRQLLGDAVDDGEEKYGMNWSGKRQARRLALTPSIGTLLPAPEDSVDWETTKNLMIEGDNLEVLKLLQKSYAGKVKIIYIDPPYNTGNDFVYSDDYKDNLGSYLRRTSQTGEDDVKNTSSADGSGRFHTDWLNMMYPRLLLARNLMTSDGICFVSCDDKEAANLRSIINLIFGEENFLSNIIWKKSYGGGSKSKHVVVHHEHVMCVAKSKNDLGRLELPADPAARKYYKLKDDKFPTRGPHRLQPLSTTSNDERENLRYPIAYDGEEIWPEKQWQWEKSRVDESMSKDNLSFLKKDDGWSVS